MFFHLFIHEKCGLNQFAPARVSMLNITRMSCLQYISLLGFTTDLWSLRPH